MTELTLDREQSQTKLPKIVKILMMMVFMGFALAVSVWLLNWTVKDKLSKFEPMESSQITAEVRERQLSCLAKNIYYEAGGEPFEGKVAVAQVTINRAASGLFPDDICKTIYQKNVIYEKVICQFSWVCDRNSGVRPPRNAVYDESMAVAKKVLLEGFRLPGLTQAMYFHADYINPGWKRERVAKIGRHIFYK